MPGGHCACTASLSANSKPSSRNLKIFFIKCSREIDLKSGAVSGEQLSEFSVDGSIIIDGPVRSNSLHVISGGSRWALRCRFDHRQHREAGLVRRAVCDTRMRSMLVVSVV